MVIVCLIILVSYTKLHPFWVLFLASICMALALGYDSSTTVEYLLTGFWKIFSGVGLLIFFGTMIGASLELSSGSVYLAKRILFFLGRLPMPFGVGVIGYLVSIPVFCDAAFIILSQLNKSISQQSKVSLKGLTVALSTGLFAPHVLVPPTPGPLVAAANLEVTNLFYLVIAGGILAFILVFVGSLYGYYIIIREGSLLSPKVSSLEKQTVQMNSDNFNLYKTLMPILLPIILMVSGAFTLQLNQELRLTSALKWLTSPTIALAIGAIFSFRLKPKNHNTFLYDVLRRGTIQAFPIIMITCMGGALATIIQTIQMEDHILRFSSLTELGILIPFCIAALLKTAQGSSTIAIITSSSIILPILPMLGLDSEMGKVWAILSLGVGSMTVSHANDSYFWVVTQMSGMSVREAYRTHTFATLLQGVIGLTLVVGCYKLWKVFIY